MEASVTDTGQRVESLIISQLAEWELAGRNYRDLDKVMLRNINMQNGCCIKVQYNPSRMRSSSARVDKKSISERPCFLCLSSLPPEQRGVDFENRYLILVNPYPIFTKHLTIPLKEHKDQLIRGRFTDMLKLAEALREFIVLYNGPRCGASAPDHFHFQAGNRGFMPVEKEFYNFPRKRLAGNQRCSIASMDWYLRHTLVLTGDEIDVINGYFEKIYDILHKIRNGDGEPMMNILAGFSNGRWRVFLFPRRAHRPAQFFEKGDGQILLSPASVDFGGVWITPRYEDYEKLDSGSVTDIFDQVSLGNEQWQELITTLMK